ncbi:hypothetical protein DYB32_008909 [Aphanomyces invadans]|uniref:Uncharacterized protein n=1 Tax=Aphanomyces invadans TaxID=157072 RepID=A0A3R6YYI2_9STRA|nr:hypothetical protein DYB32_008909 [Aphanomyces invadans]
MKMTSASGTESASPTAVPKREQKARLRAYRALKKEMKEGLRETHAQLQAELQQLRKQKQQDGGKLPWKDVAQALCEDKVEVLAQHRVFLNETVQGYAISAKIQLDANRLLCFIQAVTDEDEGEWPVHRVSQPHNRIVLVLFHQVGPTTTIIQSLYLFQSSIPEPVDVLLDKVGLTPRVETLLTTRPHHVKEYCVEDLKCRLYNQHMRSDQATSMLVYRDRWRSVFRGVHFLT